MKRAVRTVVVILICAVIMVGFYVYLDRSTSEKAENAANTQVTEKDRLLGMDLDNNYPPTPREVIKLYNRYISLCFGDPENSKLSQKDIKTVSEKIRALMDPELAKENSESQYEDSLSLEINDYRSRKAKIVDTWVCDTSDIIYGKLNGRQVAYVQASYNVREASGYARTYQKVVLRQDSSEKWKIVGFHLTDADGNMTSSGHAITGGAKTEKK